jgi:hypothetical protein
MNVLERGIPHYPVLDQEVFNLANLLSISLTLLARVADEI